MNDEPPIADRHQGLTPFAGDLQSLRVPEDPDLGPLAIRVVRAELSTDPIRIGDLAEAVADPRCGAVVTFDGMVRDHDDGRGVTGLEYSAHPEAAAVITQVTEEIAERSIDVRVAVVHRVGSLGIGETALGVAVAAPHRKLAFAVCDELVDTVKRRLPIWKRQHFTDGSTAWVGALE